MFLITLGEILFFVYLLYKILSIISFISNHNSSRHWTILIMSSISSSEIDNVVIPDPWMFWLAASAADIPADNTNGIKILLAILFPLDNESEGSGSKRSVVCNIVAKSSG